MLNRIHTLSTAHSFTGNALEIFFAARGKMEGMWREGGATDSAFGWPGSHGYPPPAGRPSIDPGMLPSMLTMWCPDKGSNRLLNILIRFIIIVYRFARYPQ